MRDVIEYQYSLLLEFDGFYFVLFEITIFVTKYKQARQEWTVKGFADIPLHLHCNVARIILTQIFSRWRLVEAKVDAQTLRVVRGTMVS